MNWQLPTIIFVVGTLLSLAIGWRRLQKKVRPAANFLLIMVAVFLGAYTALALTALNQHQVGQEQVVALLSAAKTDADEYRKYLEDYRKYLQNSSSGRNEQETAEDLVGFFRAHPRIQPLLIEKLLAQDILLRHISTVSYYNLTVLLGNIQKAQAKINSGTTTAEDGSSLINMNLREIELLSKTLSWEMLYQRDGLSVDRLAEFSEQLF